MPTPAYTRVKISECDGVRRTPSVCFCAPPPAYTRAEFVYSDRAHVLLHAVLNEHHPSPSLCLHLRIRGQKYMADGVRRAPSICFFVPTPAYTRAEFVYRVPAHVLCAPRSSNAIRLLGLYLRICGQEYMTVMAFAERHASASLRQRQRIRRLKSQNLMAFDERHPSVFCAYTCVYAGRMCVLCSRPCFLCPTLVERHPSASPIPAYTRAEIYNCDGVRRTPSACFSVPTPAYTRA